MNIAKKTLTNLLLTETDMLAFAGRIASVVESGVVIFLYGPLGAGKTTFTRGFLRGLGYSGKVKSPTYTLVEPYEINEHTIFHFDCYRLKTPDELKDIGIQDYFIPTAICLIEWPENGIPYLPDPDLACYIAFADEGREICLKAYSTRGETIIERL